MIFCFFFFKSGLWYFTVQCASCICMCVSTDKKDKGGTIRQALPRCANKQTPLATELVEEIYCEVEIGRQ